MKKYLFGLFAFVLLLLATPAYAQERIADFNTHLEIQSDGSLDVSETIIYDFGSEARHGIFRDIPTTYKTSLGTFKLRVHDINVRYEYDLGIPFETSRVGKAIRIKIGDPNTTVTGVQTYTITYTVERALGFQDGQATLTWNMTGNEWQVPIDRVSGGVVLPESIPSDDLISACYRGSYGSTESCMSLSAPAESGETRGIVFSDGSLGAGEGVTAQIGFPAGIVEAPTTARTIGYFISDNWPVAVPVIVFIVMLYLWRTRGRDPRGRGTIIPEYEAPENLTPAQVGGIFDQQVHSKDIAAEIIELAIQGYLRIRQDDKKEYTFFQMKSADDILVPAQKALFDGFFSAPQTDTTTEPGAMKQVQLKDLRDAFASTLKNVKALFESSLVSAGHYAARPDLIRAGYAIGAMVIIFGSFLLISISVIALICGILTGCIIGAFGWAMPRRTQKGVLTLEKIIGFKEYLSVVETERLKFHNAPEKKPEVFEKCLPYAMVLGVEKQWAGQFQDIYTQEPQWYQGTPRSGFNSVMFASNLSSFASQTNSTLASTSSGGGGGGGFSGGGFGGGGGGSW